MERDLAEIALLQLLVPLPIICSMTQRLSMLVVGLVTIFRPLRNT
jgi:hypothetical protein